MLDEADAWRRGAVLSADEVIVGDDVCHAEAVGEGDKVGHTYTGTMFLSNPECSRPPLMKLLPFFELHVIST
jgi:hypothetical protein